MVLPGCRTATVLLPLDTSIPTALNITRTPNRIELHGTSGFPFLIQSPEGYADMRKAVQPALTERLRMDDWLKDFRTDTVGTRKLPSHHTALF